MDKNKNNSDTKDSTAGNGTVRLPQPEKQNTDRIINERFQLIKKLGKGGMAEVYLAEDLKLKRKVAIKSIIHESSLDAQSKARFLREAQASSQLEHPNICTIYEVYEENDKDYIVMQYIDGVNLEQINKLGKLSLRKILNIADQVCLGMIEAHEQCIMHRDIKPGNIMVDKKGVVKILDFGLAKFRDESIVRNESRNTSSLTEKGIVMGTVAYMSPEQASGEELDLRTDIFSFGVVLYEMLEGHNPFCDSKSVVTHYNVIKKEVEITSDVPEKLKEIILKSMAKNREKRYGSFQELHRDLLLVMESAARRKTTESNEFSTEIIDLQEKQTLLNEVQKMTEDENLADVVYRIKKMKASTEATFIKNKIVRKVFIIIVMLALAALAIYFGLLKKRQAEEKIPTATANPEPVFFVVFNPFENKTNEKELTEQLHYLMMDSFRQIREFKPIDLELLSTMYTIPVNQINLEQLKSKLAIRYELKGEISKIQDKMYNIDAKLITIGSGKESKRITIPAKDRNAFLSQEVDNLTRRVFRLIFPDKKGDEPAFQPLSSLYGDRWEIFADFYRGKQYKDNLAPSKAEKFLLQAGQLVISKYLLADLSFFTGNQAKSQQYINEIMPGINQIPEAIRLRVLALKSRLEVRPKDEIENLKRLKSIFPLNKQILFELGEAYFHQGRAAEASKIFLEALELDKNYSDAINHLGYCFSYKGEHNKAIECFESYRDLGQSANSFDSLGDGHFYEGDLGSAESNKLAAVSLDEKMTWSYLTLVDIYILQARFGEATRVLDKYEKMLGTKKGTGAVLAKKAFIEYYNKRFGPALELINASLKDFDSRDIKENMAEIHWTKGLIHLKLNQIAEARKELAWLNELKNNHSLSIDNFHATLKFDLHLQAMLAEKDGHGPAAQAIFTSLLQMKTQLSYWITYFHYQFFHTEYAALLFRDQKFPQALQEISKCLEFNPRYVPALWIKARLLGKMNDTAYREVYQTISSVYGQSPEKNFWRDMLKNKLSQKK